jgi:hypothetical protein
VFWFVMPCLYTVCDDSARVCASVCCRLFAAVLHERLYAGGGGLVTLADRILALIVDKVEPRVVLPLLLSVYDAVAVQSSAVMLRYLDALLALFTGFDRADTKLHHKRCFEALMTVCARRVLRARVRLLLLLLLLPLLLLPLLFCGTFATLYLTSTPPPAHLLCGPWSPCCKCRARPLPALTPRAAVRSARVADAGVPVAVW